ncbi:MAG TPA: ATP-binding protein [Coleofasciculaceae cyanobacterium]
MDAVHHFLSGSFVHTILEWSAFAAATLTAILAFLHFTLHRDFVAPVIGLVLYYAGCMDAFHTLAADRLIDAAGNSADLIPFTWVLCRLFSGVILVIGLLLAASAKSQFLPKKLKFLGRSWIGSSTFIGLIAIGLGALAYRTILWCLASEHLPQTTIVDSWVTRPWDVIPLVLFLGLGLWGLPKFYRQNPSYFSLALWVSMIPQVVTQLHMAFGSTALFDTSFNIAHFLKVIAYLVPFSGLCLSYIQMNRERAVAIGELRHANQSLIRLERLSSDRATALNQALLDLQETQSQLIHAEKMSGLGQLVAGIAHEINNPVGFIRGNLRHAESYAKDLIGMIREYQKTYPDRPDHLKQLEDELDLEFLQTDFPKLMHSMQNGVLRINSIVLALRSFSGLDEEGMKWLNLQSSMEHALLILNHRLSSGSAGAQQSIPNSQTSKPAIVVETHYDSIPSVLCYCDQINQVLLHLITNAVDALEEAIKAGRSAQDSTWQPILHLELVNLGDRVRAIVRDNGIDIPETDRDRLFNPFFTTKPVGHGTGLGLSVSERIVKFHGGSIKFVTEVNRGTEFQVELPQQPDSPAGRVDRDDAD